MGWLSKLTGDARGPRLADLIPAYPPYAPPHPGPPRKLTSAKAQANLEHLMDSRPARLDVLAALLGRFGLDMKAGLGAAAPEPFLDALWQWTETQWPSIRDPELARLETWLAGERRDSPVFGLITDMGLLLGETVARRRPDYAWAVNLDDDDRKMPSFGRACVIRPSDGIVPRLVYDAEQSAQSAYAYCNAANYGVLNTLARGALEHVSGAHETWWRQEAKKHGRSALPGSGEG